MVLYPGSNYKAVGGDYIVGKTPIHTELLFVDPNAGTNTYIPVKAFQWDKTTELNDNHHSGTPLSSDEVDGPHAYTFSFETGTWLTQEASKEDASQWEWLAFTHLVRPEDAGRPKVFEIYHKQSSYIDDDGVGSGAAAILWFTGCKIEKMGFSQGENGIMKRTYAGKARRMTYGNNQEERNKA